MERYIGTKIVLAEPMDDTDFVFRVRQLAHTPTIGPDGRGAPGYLVVYEDGYRSWSPAETFERAYRRITDAEINLIENCD